MPDSDGEPQSQRLRDNIRRTFRERRRNLSALEKDKSAHQLVALLDKQQLLHKGAHVALYKTNDAELSTEPLITYCWQQEINVYLPVLHPFTNGHLLFLRYTTETAMQSNRFGIMEPKIDVTAVCPARDLDAIFTPLVAFDDSGNRLGMGGGFYDRTLSALQGNVHSPKVIGLAYDIQRTSALPVETWDIPLPAIATPSKIYSF